MIDIIKYSSLHLSWIYKKTKQLTLPKLVYIDEHSEYGGFYANPSYFPFEFEGHEIPCDKGIIFAVESDTCMGTIAHEWRHHWQKLNGWDLEYDNYNYKFSDHDTYDSEIIRFFTDNDFEMDALKFEYTHAKDWLNSERIDMLGVRV